MLTDGVITLRHPTMDDVDAICAGCQDPEVPKWTGVPSPYTRENAVEWIERTVEERDAQAHAGLHRRARRGVRRLVQPDGAR